MPLVQLNFDVPLALKVQNLEVLIDQVLGAERNPDCDWKVILKLSVSRVKPILDSPV